MSDFGVFLLVAALGGVTLVTRSFFFMFKKELPFPTWADRGLRYAPIAALSAVIIPEIVMRHGALITDWRDGRIFGAAAGAAAGVGGAAKRSTCAEWACCWDSSASSVARAWRSSEAGMPARRATCTP